MNKKLIYSLCVLLLLSVSLNIFLLQPEYQTRMKAIAQAVTNTPLRGDVDGDGVVTAGDARIVLRIAVGLEDDTPTPQPSALTKEQAIEIYKNANNMIVHFMGYTVDWNNTIQYNEHFEAGLVNATKAEMMQKFNQYLDIAFFDDYFDWMYVEVDNKVYQKNIPFGVESFSYSVHSELEYVDGIYTLNTIDANSSIDGIFIRDTDFSYIFEYQNGHWVLSKECIINGEKGELSYWGFFEHDFLENCTESQLPATRIKPVFADSSFYGTTTTMYRSPSHTSDTVRSVSLDDDIVVLGYNETDPDWVFVMHEHSFGWIRSNLINYEADEPEQKTDDTPLRGDVDGDGVVTAGDARIVLRIAVGLEDAEENKDYDLSKIGPYTTANTEYVIGATGPLTGDHSSYGISVRQGATLAVEEINAAGGLNGVMFKFDMKDDKGTVPDATTGYVALYEAGMQVSLGSVTSGSCEAFAARADEDCLFVITPSASADSVIATSDYAFRVCFGNYDQGVLAAEELAAAFTKIGAIYDNSDPYSTGIYEAFKAKMAELGVEYIEQSFNAANNRNFSTQVEALKDCDAIFLPLYYTEAGLIAKTCTAKGCDALLFGCDGLDGIAGQIDYTVTNTIKYIMPFDVNSKDALVTDFVAAYTYKYGKAPDQFAADGYDAVFVIYNTMRKAGVNNVAVDPGELGKALVETITADNFYYKGVTGLMKWYATGACKKIPQIVTIN